MQAKWISYKYDFPFVYKSFPFSELLRLNQLELNQLELNQDELNQDELNQDELNQDELNQDELDQLELNQDELDWTGLRQFAPLIKKRNFWSITNNEPYAGVFFYDVKYFQGRSWGEDPEMDEETAKSLDIPFCVDWDDKEFRMELRKNVSPIVRPNFEFVIPEDRISVAIHFRVSPFQREKFHKRWPVKSPRIEYFLDQLNFIDELLMHKPLFVHIFTNAIDPVACRRVFQKKFADRDMIFFVRQSRVKKGEYVLEDFFGLMEFDCIIHGDSNFSNCAALLSNPLIEIKALPISVGGGGGIRTIRTRIAMEDGMILYSDRDPETGEITRERTVYIE